MQETVKSIFDDECANLEIGPKIVKRLNQYYHAFISKNEDHIKFFGGNLLGVEVVRFTDADRSKWFDEILELVDGPVEDRLLALPTINPEFIVSSDTMNLSCIWLAHAIFNSARLNDEQKHEAMVNVFIIMQIKFFTSRCFRLFRYPANKATAEATYEQLSYKFAIKVHGSWGAFFTARSKEIVSKEGIWYKTITLMDNDGNVVKALNDIQGRISAMLKVIYGVFLQVDKQKIKIATTSSVVEYDGVEVLKDKSKNLTAYIRYINSIITDKNSFIREELFAVIEKLMHTASPRMIKETLIYMSDNYRQNGAKEIEQSLEEILLHSFDYLTQNKALIRNSTDLAGLLSKIRGVYTSSRSSDPVLLSIREKVEKIVSHATGNKNTSIIASVRTAVCLYIVLRSFTMKHYS